jgi:hypothetical protein
MFLVELAAAGEAADANQKYRRDPEAGAGDDVEKRVL